MLSGKIFDCQESSVVINYLTVKTTYHQKGTGLPMSLKYRRVLIKISGEALSGEKGSGFDFGFVTSVCESVKQCLAQGAQIGIVIGGGNFWRGVKDGAGKVERVSADRMGMLATAMNCLAVADVFRQCGVDARVMTAVDIQGVGERHDVKKQILKVLGAKSPENENPFKTLDNIILSLYNVTRE